MKILFIQKEGGIFGAENFQLKIIPALLAKGVKIEFLRLYTNYQGGQGGDFVERLNIYGVKTHEINIGKYPKLKSLKQIKRLVKAGQFDLVHTHLIHADFHLSKISLLLGGVGCPWVSTKHGYDNGFTAKFGFDASKQGITPYYLLARLSERLCTKSYTISHGLRNFFIKTGLAKPNKMEMIHYGFDFEPTSDQLLDGQFRKFEQQIVIAGRLINFKGHHYLLDAIKLLMEKLPKAGLVIAGSGEIEGQLKSRVAKEGLSEHVFFAGYSKEVIKWMYNSDLVAVPSISEGFGVVFLEAFNCKKPVVAWNVPAGNELMKEGETGYLVEPYNTRALAEKIAHILKNPTEAEEVGLKAHQKLKNYFNLDRMTHETLAFYQSVLK
ncbi:Glycosyltransferase involved in cell wall bisynthesis [Marivirga sericea]|uniref:Glycosyltransferase involved in cell wall bisynthesis n=1 Tax=Marivirga sericea TaxID=1028 RepID=A0A1X7IJH7_9BACT|nr:glycosyltransferase family 4 protein [Marivirga sericea]SMG14945.1 Glycosyltransferase involved in cell wall bisynthesis [Marivirga sericea]